LLSPEKQPFEINQVVMSEEIELLKIVAARLDSAGIEYMMTGSMAMALYATPRMTRDIDIIIQISMQDASRITSLFETDFYIEKESILEAIRSRGMFNIIHNESVIKVDLIIRKQEEYRLEEFSRRTAVVIDGVKISVVTPEDLVLSKLVWAKQSESELQQRDVRQLLQSSSGMDAGYIQKWAKVLGVEDLLKKALNHA
jgi:predicted nucleotidyltransferase